MQKNKRYYLWGNKNTEVSKNISKTNYTYPKFQESTFTNLFNKYFSTIQKLLFSAHI